MNQIENKKSEKLTARDRSRPGYLLEIKSTRTRVPLTNLKPNKVSHFTVVHDRSCQGLLISNASRTCQLITQISQTWKTLS